MNIDNMSNLGTTQFLVTFSSTSQSGEALMQALTVSSPSKQTTYPIKAGATSLVIFLGESPYSQQLNIALTATSSTVIWQTFNGYDRITFDNTATDLSGVGFPQNRSNFYWVIS